MGVVVAPTIAIIPNARVDSITVARHSSNPRVRSVIRTPKHCLCSDKDVLTATSRKQVTDALKMANQPTEHIEGSLFQCVPGSAGDIKFLSFCGANSSQCKNGGSAQNDYCDTNRCSRGIDYCGSTLLGKGKSRAVTFQGFNCNTLV